MLRLIGVALMALPIGSWIALAEDLKLPPLKRQSTPQAVIDEHMDALNKCDWNRIMAQYPPDYQLRMTRWPGRKRPGRGGQTFRKLRETG